MRPELVAVIPAQESNRYSDQGDLAPFGNFSLLEWKIAQLKELFEPASIYVSTSSDKVKLVAQKAGVKTIQRSLSVSFTDMIIETLEQVPAEDILWANVTSPYLGASLIVELISQYDSLESDYDSVVACKKLSEYMLYKGKSFNFEMDRHTGREGIEPVYQITNGCYIASKKTCLKYKKQFGVLPQIFEVDRLSSYEIKDVSSLAIASELISQYFSENEI